jgi:hypothetical protein
MARAGKAVPQHGSTGEMSVAATAGGPAAGTIRCKGHCWVWHSP